MEQFHNEQFLLFPQRFLHNQMIVSPFVHISNIKSLFAAELEEPQPSPKQACLQYESFQNTVGKGEIAQNKQFLHFPQCLQHFSRTFHHFH